MSGPACTRCGKGLSCAACTGRRGGQSRSPEKLRAATKNAKKAARARKKRES